MATLLLIRPQAQSRRLLEALVARGLRHPAVISPVIEICARQVVLPQGVELVLTSQNAVASLPPGRWRAWCVGNRTAAAAAAAGLEALSADGDVETLLRRLAQARPKALIHVRGAHSAGDLLARLRAAQLPADEVVGYDQVARPLTSEAAALLAGADVVVLPLYSPRSARLVAEHQGPWKANVHAVAISAAAAEAFRRPAWMTMAESPTGDAMEQAIAAALDVAERSRLVDRDGAG